MGFVFGLGTSRKYEMVRFGVQRPRTVNASCFVGICGAALFKDTAAVNTCRSDGVVLMRHMVAKGSVYL